MIKKNTVLSILRVRSLENISLLKKDSILVIILNPKERQV